jgi:glycosyltransferase involved in cell wall biosynthesis
MKTNYLYYFCDGLGSVFDSQVLALLKFISENKFFKKVYLFLGIRNENQKIDFLARKLSIEIEIIFFKSYPNYPFFNFMLRKSIQTALHSQSINFKEVIFHTRGEIIAWHLSKILSNEYHKNIIPDVRGANIEEIEEFSGLNKIARLLKIINNKKAVRNLNKFSKISAISNSLKEYLITNYGIDTKKLFITPCLAGTDFRFDESKREYIRKEFNLIREDKLIVFSSGGTANWQNNEVLIMLAEKGLKVLNLSKKEINHKNIVNKFISYSEMPAYLNAADVAIIWRDKSIVNKVASPVKFSEYICCGLPVIANESVDMISEYITKHSCGILIDSLENINLKDIKDLNLKDCAKISEEGILNFGIDTIVNDYLKTYLSFINE